MACSITLTVAGCRKSKRDPPGPIQDFCRVALGGEVEEFASAGYASIFHRNSLSQMIHRFFQLCALGGVLTALNGCDTLSEMVTANMPDTHSGRASIVVSLRAQEAYLYRGKILVASSRISSGKEGHRTPIGRFRLIRRDEDHRSSVYGAFCDSENRIVKPDVDSRRDHPPRHTHFVGASMPYFLEFSPGYGLHQGYLPGEPASHGCIRMPYWKARQFYNAARIGTPVIVKP